MMTISRTFPDWLNYIESLHPQNIEMGLARIAPVHKRLPTPLSCVVLTVGGTNGKGSTCTMLEAMLMAAGYRVGLYTSPHILHFNERARINGVQASDAALVQAFEAVEAARGGTQLTYFEFTTLAILHLFAEAQLDAVILEVGLGGRLDATNLVDADVAVVTNVGIDHVEFLGDTRAAIGFEKAGIFRTGRVAICGDDEPPLSLMQYAKQIGADLRCIGRDFSAEAQTDHWHWRGRSQQRMALSYPALQGANQIINASVALAAIEAIAERLPVSDDAVRAGLAHAVLPGRFQQLSDKPVVILDVAHNPHAAVVLADNLKRQGTYPRTFGIFGAMRDKDIAGVIACMREVVTDWCLTDLPLPRAATAAELSALLAAAGNSAPVQTFASPEKALDFAFSQAGENDRIAVFGSFWTVAGAIEHGIRRHPLLSA